MRPLELLLLALVAVSMLRPALSPGLRARVTGPLLVAVGLAAVAHGVFEGFRWQLAPVYVVAGLLFLTRAVRRPAADATPRRGFVMAATLLAVVLLGAGAALGTLIPVTGFPTPTGPYMVGTETHYWVDETRGEPATPAPDDRREVMVQVWYPAAPFPADEPRAPYMAHMDVVGPRLATNLRLPPFFLNHVALMRTNAVADAARARAGAPYPVLIFSHGNTGIRAQNTVQFEELASHGYVVASVDHTYNSLITLFPDGRTALYQRGDIEFLSGTPEAERRHAERVAFRAADVRFVLDQLERAQAGELDMRVGGALDLERVGVFGHSYGGATATQVCRLDPRFKAGIDLDGWIWGDAWQVGLTQPYMFMGATVHFQPGEEALARVGITRAEYDAHMKRHGREFSQLFDTLGNDGYHLRIAGMAHYNFTDIPLISPLTTTLGLTGPIDGRRGLDTINAYTLAFFNRYLRGQSSPLLDGPSPEFPEVELRIHHPAPDPARSDVPDGSA